MTLFWRIAFSLLVLGNLLFFSWSQGYFGRIDDGREPQRYTHQLQPDKLRVMPFDETAAPPPATLACRAISGLGLAEARQLQEKTQADVAADEIRLEIKPLELPPGHWVHIPALENQAAVDKKLLELKQRGVTDAVPLLNEGTDHFAISLGMFSTPEAANAHLQALAKRGVRSATIEMRPRPAGKALVEAYGAEDILLKHLPELLSGITHASIAECRSEEQP